MTRDALRVWLKLDRIRCNDEGDGPGSAEPYLWTVFFKIDGDTVALKESLTLAGAPTVIGTAGSHENLLVGSIGDGDVITIPAQLGEWNPYLQPISVPPSLQPVVGDDLPGILGAVCILMEEDNVTDDGAEAGHRTLDSAVEAALTEIVASRSFANPNVNEDEIDQYVDGIVEAVENAVQSQQTLLENLWSWTNPDDTIGSKVFFWTQDDLANGEVTFFSERWQKEGSWTLYGHVNASVACTVEAAAAASSIIDVLLGQNGAQLRSIRNEIVAGTQLQAWWAMVERHGPQLVYACQQDSKLFESVAAVMRETPLLLQTRTATVPEAFLDHIRRLLEGIRRSGGRRSRIDAERALDVLKRMDGFTVAETLQYLSTVPPSRYPNERLVVARGPVETSVADPG